MSLTMKTLMTALLLLLVIAQWNTASAQVSQMRLFSPVRSDQFGGNGRLREGMFGEVSYNYWLITKGRNQTIGWVADDPGKQNLYFSGTAFMPRTNTISTSALGNTFTDGTTLRIGNMVKHHGWEIKTTLMKPQTDTYMGRSGSMDIKDDPYSTTVYVPPQQAFQAWVFTGNPDQKFDYINSLGEGSQPNIPIGYLWGWNFLGANAGGFPANDLCCYGLAPLPITFDRYKLESKISHWDVEANYIFRAHATRVGFFEFTGGVRYMQLDDKLTFSGWGMPWRGDVRIEPDGAYGGDNIPGGGTTTGGTGGTGGTGTTTIVNYDITEYYLENGSLPGLDRNYMYTGNIRGAGTVLADSRWNFEAQNHLVGPQAGIRYIRKCSGRWSLIADTKFFAGFNTQNIKSNGTLGERPAGTYIENMGRIAVGTSAEEDIFSGPGNLPWVPIGTLQNPGTFRHSQTRTAFSPGIDFGLKAKWQFTDAIAFSAGYQGMYLDKTARASLINSYEIDMNNNIFGINDNVNQSTWMHGVSLEVSLNRF